MADVIKDTENKMKSALERLKHDLSGLRTGRANPSLVDALQVEVYGSKMRLLDIASISIPEPRQLLITPYDGSNVHAIVKAIDAANLNVKGVADGAVVRIKIPEMDAAVRAEMVKQGKKRCEEAKIGVRNARRDGNDTLKKQKNEGIIPEDQLKKGEKKIQELTDKYCKDADTMTEQKEKEIMTV